MILTNIPGSEEYFNEVYIKVITDADIDDPLSVYSVILNFELSTEIRQLLFGQIQSTIPMFIPELFENTHVYERVVQDIPYIVERLKMSKCDLLKMYLACITQQVHGAMHGDV